MPHKLVDHICRWEYIDTLAEGRGEGIGPAAVRKPPQEAGHKPERVDSVLRSVCGGACPKALRGSAGTGTAWVRYDAAYPRQAAVSGNRTWSRINPYLYALCFTGKAQAAKRCDLCLSVSHESKECSILTETDPDLPSQLKGSRISGGSFCPGAAEWAGQARRRQWGQIPRYGMQVVEREALLFPALPLPPRIRHLWGATPSSRLLPGEQVGSRTD